MSNPHAPSDLRGRSPAEILEQLAVAVMSTDAADEAGVAQMLTLLDALAAVADATSPIAAAAATRIRAGAADVRALAEALDAASEDVARMQEMVAKAARQPEQPPPGATAATATADPGAFVLPEWSDDKTLNDFLAAQRVSLEELEEAILGMEGGDPDRRAAFKRRLHTLKGEAGVLGLEDLERVCHAAEDSVEANGVSAELTDRLLKAADWMVKAVDAYARMRLPQPRAAEFVSAVLAAPFETAAAPGAPATVTPPAALPTAAVTPAAAPPTPPPASTPPAATAAPDPSTEKVERDAETISLFGEFLTESGEGLNRVDQILMEVERGGVGGDTVNSLFRVFHTVKGTAGFLDLTEVVSLAHETETMLNKCRENALALSGTVIDLVFDATSALREMLENVRVAVETGTGFPHREGLEALVRRIQDVTEGAASEQEPEAQPAAEAEEIAPAAAPPPAAIAAHVQPKQDARPAPALEEEAQSAAEPAPAAAEPIPAEAAPSPTEPAQRAPAQRAQARGPAADQDGPVKLKDTIKVDLERVDSLVEMIGELVVVESMVVNAPEIAKASSVRVRNCLAQLAKVTRDLQDVGMRMRMVPVAGVFQKMARLVRDLSRRNGKQVQLITSGESTEMDRSMVEQIADPLVHMIRNSCDHGLEPVEDRVAAGKSPGGTIRLSAYHEGGSVVIEIADDGRGLNKDRIVKKAIEKGLIVSADGMSEDEINGLIFAPGFSTAAKVTEISGRGVGMDVVKRNIEAMRGRVLISSTPGQGTKFKLVLPLTLAIIDGMLVACGDERYIIPTLSIAESIQPDRKMLVSFAQKNEMINLRGEILPLLRLDRLFGLPGAKGDPTEALVVVVEGMGRRIGLLVDEVVTQQQVVIKNLGEGMGEARFLSGAAILSDGRVGLILNIEEIATLVARSSHDFFRDRAMLSTARVAAQEAQA